MRLMVVICGLLLGFFLAAVAQAAASQSLVAGWQAIVSNPWNLVTFIDLSIGLLFVAAWMVMMEPRRWFAAAWLIALLLLGNGATLAFLLCRSRNVDTFRELFLPGR